MTESYTVYPYNYCQLYFIVNVLKFNALSFIAVAVPVCPDCTGQWSLHSVSALNVVVIYVPSMNITNNGTLMRVNKHLRGKPSNLESLQIYSNQRERYYNSYECLLFILNQEEKLPFLDTFHNYLEQLELWVVLETLGCFGNSVV